MATAADVLEASELSPAADPNTIELTVRVRRFHPEVSQDSVGRVDRARCDPFERLVEVLHRSSGIDGTLSFRRSCAHSICIERDVDRRPQPATCKVLAQTWRPA
jgi:succinate dehydrogenase / fumarate reductase iron-sulfur subunit